MNCSREIKCVSMKAGAGNRICCLSSQISHKIASKLLLLKIDRLLRSNSTFQTQFLSNSRIPCPSVLCQLDTEVHQSINMLLVCMSRYGRSVFSIAKQMFSGSCCFLSKLSPSLDRFLYPDAKRKRFPRGNCLLSIRLSANLYFLLRAGFISFLQLFSARFFSGLETWGIKRSWSFNKGKSLGRQVDDGLLPAVFV